METIVKTSTRDDPFARVPKDLLDDPSISWRAKGILSYLIGKPKGWKMRVQDIQRHGTEGRDAIRASLLELRKAGYAELVRLRDKGKTKEWVWKISDSKIFEPPPDRPEKAKKSPDAENPDLAKPLLVNPYSNKKDEVQRNTVTEKDIYGSTLVSELPESEKTKLREEFQRVRESFLSKAKCTG